MMYKVNSSGTDLRRKCRSQAQRLAINHSFLIKERGLNNVAGSAGVKNGNSGPAGALCADISSRRRQHVVRISGCDLIVWGQLRREGLFAAPSAVRGLSPSLCVNCSFYVQCGTVNKSMPQLGLSVLTSAAGKDSILSGSVHGISSVGDT